MVGNSGLVVNVFSWALSIVSCFAIAALYELTHGLMDRLEGLNPWRKLVAVKVVVFFTWYQGLFIACLVSYTNLFNSFLDEEAGWNTEQQIATGVNNFLLCTEMTLISLAHFYAFPPDDYKQVLASRGVFLETSAGGRPLNYG